MTQWEYKCVYKSEPIYSPNVENYLNEMGSKGWEVIYVEDVKSYTNYTQIVLKRKKRRQH